MSPSLVWQEVDHPSGYAGERPHMNPRMLSSVELEPIRVRCRCVATDGALHPLAVTVPLPTWIRPAVSSVCRLTPQPAPGTHTREVLLESGFSADEVEAMLKSGAVCAAWPALAHGRYLPL